MRAAGTWCHGRAGGPSRVRSPLAYSASRVARVWGLSPRRQIARSGSAASRDDEKDAGPPRHIAARRRLGLADDPIASEQLVQQVAFLLDLRAKAESFEAADRIVSGRAGQVGQRH